MALGPFRFASDAMDAIATTVAIRANGYLEAMIATETLSWEVEHGMMEFDFPGAAADAR